MTAPSSSRWAKLSLVVLAVYWLALCCGTHVRQPPPIGASQWDKAIHFAAFAVLAVLLLLAWSRFRTPARQSYEVAFSVLVVYAAADEFSQLVVGRSCDPWDWVADVSGAVVGLTLVAAMGRRGGAG